MIKIEKKAKSSIQVLNIGPLNIYDSAEDRIYLKKVLSNIFSIGDELFFFFRREENLTDDAELKRLKQDVLREIKINGEFRYILKLDDKRFDAIAKVNLNSNFANLIISMWKYFYACDFFKLINELTFDEYEDYLRVNGVDDIGGIGMIQNKLTDFICVKGLGADHLIISYNAELKLDTKL